MRINLPTVARECDRYVVFNWSEATVASALLKDLRIANETEQENIRVNNKIRRERDK